METVKFSKLEVQLILRLLYSELKNTDDEIRDKNLHRHIMSGLIVQLEDLYHEIHN